MKNTIALALICVISTARAASVPDYDSMALSVRALLNDLVAADTTNPPGNEARAVTLAMKKLRASNIPYEISEFAPGRQNIVARIKGDGTERPLLLLAHIDVVGAEGQAWTMPPHKMTEKDGFLYGRGVSDDLGMAAIILETLIQLKQTQTPLRRDIIVAWTGDEESGGAGIAHILRKNRLALDAGLLLNEGGGPILGEDGKAKFIDLQVAEKTYQDFEFAAQGTTGHSSVPLKDNAIYKIAAAVDRLAKNPFPARLTPFTRAYFEHRSKQEIGKLATLMKKIALSRGTLSPALARALEEQDPIQGANIRTTCVATLVKGGTRENALPASASANVNCRILPDESPEQV